MDWNFYRNLFYESVVPHPENQKSYNIFPIELIGLNKEFFVFCQYFHPSLTQNFKMILQFIFLGEPSKKGYILSGHVFSVFKFQPTPSKNCLKISLQILSFQNIPSIFYFLFLCSLHFNFNLQKAEIRELRGRLEESDGRESRDEGAQGTVHFIKPYQNPVCKWTSARFYEMGVIKKKIYENKIF